MLLLLLISFIMEDSIVPSLRLSALGSDFALLIEDPLTDIQFNPARLGNLEGLTLYFKPEWSTYFPYRYPYYYVYRGGGKISAAMLCPKALGNMCFGFLGSYSYIKTHSIYDGYYDNEYGGDAYFDTASYLGSYPSLNFFVAMPFIKDGGFLGSKARLKNLILNGHGRINTYLLIQAIIIRILHFLKDFGKILNGTLIRQLCGQLEEASISPLKILL